MNKYVIPICDLNESKIYNLVLFAKSISDCKDKIINHFSDKSIKDEYDELVEDLDSKDILVGDIKDIEEL